MAENNDSDYSWYLSLLFETGIDPSERAEDLQGEGDDDLHTDSGSTVTSRGGADFATTITPFLEPLDLGDWDAESDDLLDESDDRSNDNYSNGDETTSSEDDEEEEENEDEEEEFNRGEIDGLFCPICLEAWSSGGDHSVCCLPCGHIYGLDCIKKWLQGRGSGKCPQCRKKCSMKRIRLLYASRIVSVDEELQKKVRCLEAKCGSLKKKTSIPKSQANAQQSQQLSEVQDQRVARLEANMARLRADMVQLEANMARLDERFNQLDARLAQQGPLFADPSAR